MTIDAMPEHVIVSPGGITCEVFRATVGVVDANSVVVGYEVEPNGTTRRYIRAEMVLYVGGEQTHRHYSDRVTGLAAQAIIDAMPAMTVVMLAVGDHEEGPLLVGTTTVESFYGQSNWAFH